MIKLDLTSDERRILLEILENELSDMRMEIANTDSMDFREMLKGRKEVVKKVIAGLRGAAGSRSE